MKLHVLGSGSCVVNQQDRTPSGYLLETEEKLLLIDTGTGITRNIPDTKFTVDDIDAVINTHRHPDHVSDLIPIVQDKVVRSFSQDEPGITLYGPQGHIEYLEDRIMHEMAEVPEDFEENFGFNLEIKTLEEETEIEGLEIDTTEAVHGPEYFKCLSLRFETEDKTIVFTGDTDYNPELEGFSDDADMIVADCSKPDGRKLEGHMTPSECGEIAIKAEAGSLLLSHLYPETDDVDVVSQAEAEFPGEVVMAEDLMTLEI